jgi:hypothetical protein
MQQILKLGPVDIKQLVGSDDFDICHQKSRFEASTRYALLNARVCNANLVNDVTVCRNDGVVGFASEDIDDAAGLVIVSSLCSEEWAS